MLQRYGPRCSHFQRVTSNRLTKALHRAKERLCQEGSGSPSAFMSQLGGHHSSLLVRPVQAISTQGLLALNALRQQRQHQQLSAAAGGAPRPAAAPIVLDNTGEK